MSLTDSQKRAVESIDCHVLVSAGAGSGKTHVLVERYLEILKRSPDTSVSALVAVTYTKKAAREMHSRLKVRVGEIAAASADEAHRQRWQQVRAEIDSAKIGTIHSLCESILKTFPAEAGVDPQFDVLDDLEAAEVLTESIEGAMRAAAFEEGGEAQLLMDYPVTSVSAWVGSLLKSSLRLEEALQACGSFSDEDLERLVERLLAEVELRLGRQLCAERLWRSTLCDLEEMVLAPDNGLERVRKQALEKAHHLEEICSGLPDRIRAGSISESVLALRKSIDLRPGKKDDRTAAVKDVLRLLREIVDPLAKDLPQRDPEIDRVAFGRTRALVALTRRAQRLYGEAKSARQKLDFDDMIRSTYDLLRAPRSSARQYYNSLLRAVLVDEFQDTNRMQADILSMLAGAHTRLFLIGDDKQSIYKFQGADVSTFNEWKETFERALLPAGLSGTATVETLADSFRSHPDIVSTVNAVFESLLDNGADLPAYKARFQPLKPKRGKEASPACIDLIAYGTDDNEGMRADERLDVEAQLVAAWIAEKVKGELTVEEKSGVVRPARYGDFAVLVQRNGDFRRIEHRLALCGIPYVALGGAGFLLRQEVFDLENMLRFIASPADCQSLLGVLRSPMFAITDDIIHDVKGGHDGSLWHLIRRRAIEPGSPFRAAVPVLEGLVSACGRMSLPDLVRRIIHDTRYDIVLSASGDGRQRSRNLWRLLDLAHAHCRKSPLEFAQCLESMRKLKVKQAAAPVDLGDSVKLMTIHGSKGLEFPIVVLPVLGVDAARIQDKVKCHRDFGVAFDSSLDKDSPKPTLVRLARLIEKDMTIAEKKRLFYVGLTRARDHLALFVDRQGTARQSFRSWLVSSLGLAGDSLFDAGTLRAVPGAEGVNFALRTQIAAIAPAQTAPQSKEEDVRTDLVADLRVDSPEIRSDWKLRSRVTPGPGGAKVKEAVVGDFFHALMERLSQKVEPMSDDILMDVIASEVPVVVHPQSIAELLGEGREMLARFFSSELHPLMERAARRLHEPPYMIAAPGLPCATKRPDLIIEEAPGAWCVVDYKTDMFDLAQLSTKVNEHRAQVDGYADDIEKLTARRPRTALYFARHGILSWF